MFRTLNLFLLLHLVNQATSVGKKSFEACKEYGQSMLECKNILNPVSRVRVPIDLLLFPHMVLVGFGRKEEKPQWKCGGSLITPSYVLSAAHCKKDHHAGEARLLRIGTATFEFDELDDLVQERSISDFIVHPEYAPPSKYHDIALIRADEPFILSRDIRIACLERGVFPEENLTVIGFGTTVSGGTTGSETLMKVDVDLVDRVKCNKSMKSLIKRKVLDKGIIDDQLCAGDYENGGRDTCQGDSGGPLQYMPNGVDCKETFPLHVVVGVTSFGRDCGRKKAPGVYTKVSNYVEWIESVVWPDSSD